PVELAVSRIVWPLMLPGCAAKALALSPLTSSALPRDSSLLMPMVTMPKRTAPRVAGTDPAPPTSQLLEADAAICGTPAGNVLNVGLRPTSAHQCFSVAM